MLHHATYADIDWERFRLFYEEAYGEPVEPDKEQKFENLRLGQDGKPSLAGALLFTRNPEKTITGFFITAIWFRGYVLEDHSYIASEYLRGTLSDQYRQGMDFILRTLHHIQSGDSFNSPGVLEIPQIVFEELLTNALLHRDYFIRDTVKLYIFQDRIEITSPGRLPNNLTVEQAKKEKASAKSTTTSSIHSRQGS
ncbi:MAG: hypothetical protein OHK0039_29170 [Bacteroidia bacterium]